MVSQYLSEVKELVKTKLTESIGNSNPVEKSMAYSAIAESKMVRAGLIFASSEMSSSLEHDSVITLAASIELMHNHKRAEKRKPSVIFRVRKSRSDSQTRSPHRLGALDPEERYSHT